MLKRVLLSAGLLASVQGHSQMTCLHSKPGTVINGANAMPGNYQTDCLAPIRNAGWMLQKTEYSFGGCAATSQPCGTTENVNNPCEFKFPGWKGTNSLSQFYSNGIGCGGDTWSVPCPNPMGTLAAGQKITVWWEARNHADPNHRHKTVQLYISGANPNADLSKSGFLNNGMFCELPFDSNCQGGVGQRPCSGECTLPAGLVNNAKYTIWWYWPWKFPGEPTDHGGLETYATCADITVTGGAAATPTKAPTIPPTVQPGTASCLVMQPNWHYGNGGDIAGMPLTKTTPEACAEACTADPTCLCFAWDTGGVNKCWLKNDNSICSQGGFPTTAIYSGKDCHPVAGAPATKSPTAAPPTNGAPPPQTYTWFAYQWGSCDKSCGGGTMTRTVLCVSASGLPGVDSDCKDAKPATTSACNTAACSTDSTGTTFSVKMTVRVVGNINTFNTDSFLRDCLLLHI